MKNLLVSSVCVFIVYVVLVSDKPPRRSLGVPNRNSRQLEEYHGYKEPNMSKRGQINSLKYKQ